MLLDIRPMLPGNMQLPIEAGLRAVGDLLAAGGNRASIVVVGGASLNLLGLLLRTTSDVDVIARVEREADGSLRLIHAEPFPPPLQEAIRTVARDFGLDPDWMNADVGKQWSQGFPPALMEELAWRTYGGLEVGLVGRRTLVALKLFAAVDCGPGSVHAQDLRALRPTDAEWTEATAWVETQDAAAEFPTMVRKMVEHVRADPA